MTDERPPLRIVLHAPTADALTRARANARNLARAPVPPSVRIVVNADAVNAALDLPNAATDALTLVCANTLARLQRAAPAPLTLLPESAVLALATMQAAGWCYIRA